MEDYIIGLDLVKPDAIDNSILRIEIIVPKQGDISSYIDKPVTLNDDVIGVIVAAVEINHGYKLMMMIWTRKIKSCRKFINNDLSTISIESI